MTLFALSILNGDFLLAFDTLYHAANPAAVSAYREYIPISEASRKPPRAGSSNE